MLNLLEQDKHEFFEETKGHQTAVKEGKTEVEFVLRTVLCSATIEKLHKKEDNPLEKLISKVKFKNKVSFIKLASKELLPSRLKISFYQADNHLKELYLFHLITENKGKNIVVFCNSVNSTQRLHSIFSFFEDFTINCLYAKISQNQRTKNIERFKANWGGSKPNVLFCSDVAARGLDFPSLDLVVHFHVPKTVEFFVHRSGRTARAFSSGETAVLVSRKEHQNLSKIYVALKIKEDKFLSIPDHLLEKYKGFFEFVKEEESAKFKANRKVKEAEWLLKQSAQTELDIGEDLSKTLEIENERKVLNRKRKRAVNGRLKETKLLNDIQMLNLPKSSFLTPDVVEKLALLEDATNDKKLNLSESIREADFQKGTVREKRKKARHVKRRRGNR